MRGRTSFLGLALLLVLRPGSGLAEVAVDLGAEASAPVDEASTNAASEWMLELIPYFWIPANTTNVTIGSESVKTCTSIRDGLSLFVDGEGGGGMFHLAAKKERLSLWADFVFNSLDKTIEGRLVDLRIKNLSYFVEYGAGYDLLQYPTTVANRMPITLGLLVGARWTRMSNEIDLVGLRSAKDVTEFMDPLVGGRSAVPLWDFGSAGFLAATFRGDIGGFGAGSDLSWNLVGGLRWATMWKALSADVILYAGYKAYYTRFSSEEDDIETTAALQYNGPLLGIGFRF